MELLDHPQAQALLQYAQLSAAAVTACAEHLEALIARYLPARQVRKRRSAHRRDVLT